MADTCAGSPASLRAPLARDSRSALLEARRSSESGNAAAKPTADTCSGPQGLRVPQGWGGEVSPG
eukprot:13967404-Alexandrium_andersonii.AAC.1